MTTLLTSRSSRAQRESVFNTNHVIGLSGKFDGARLFGGAADAAGQCHDPLTRIDVDAQVADICQKGIRPIAARRCKQIATRRRSCVNERSAYERPPTRSSISSLLRDGGARGSPMRIDSGLILSFAAFVCQVVVTSSLQHLP